MSNPHPSATFTRLPVSEMIARREESIERIGKALTEANMTVAQVAERFTLPRETAYGHLMYMEGLGLAHRTGEKAGQCAAWAAGEKQQVEQPRPRVEVNVHRHWMDVALFGPARRAA